jgi:hypothetical protein
LSMANRMRARVSAPRARSPLPTFFLPLHTPSTPPSTCQGARARATDPCAAGRAHPLVLPSTSPMPTPFPRAVCLATSAPYTRICVRTLMPDALFLCAVRSPPPRLFAHLYVSRVVPSRVMHYARGHLARDNGTAFTACFPIVFAFLDARPTARSCPPAKRPFFRGPSKMHFWAA